MESTMPVAAPARATSGRDFDPISSSWRNSSRISNGGVTAARATCQKNIPRSPNHSRNSLITRFGEVNVNGAVRKSGCAASGAGPPATAVNFCSITDLILDLDPEPELELELELNLNLELAQVPRVHYPGACGEAASAVRCKGIQDRS